jgi:hypothetical protein
MDLLPAKGALPVVASAMKRHLGHMQLFVSGPMAIMVLSKNHGAGAGREVAPRGPRAPPPCTMLHAIHAVLARVCQQGRACASLPLGHSIALCRHMFVLAPDTVCGACAPRQPKTSVLQGTLG